MQRILRHLGRFRAPVGIAALLVGCGGSDLTLPSQTGPTAIARVQGDHQTGAAGQPLPDSLTVQVIDLRGDPVPGQRVAFVGVPITWSGYRETIS